MWLELSWRSIPRTAPSYGPGKRRIPQVRALVTDGAINHMIYHSVILVSTGGHRPAPVISDLKYADGVLYFTTMLLNRNPLLALNVSAAVTTTDAEGNVRQSPPVLLWTCLTLRPCHNSPAFMKTMRPDGRLVRTGSHQPRPRNVCASIILQHEPVWLDVLCL
jgi:hypothetical protein